MPIDQKKIKESIVMQQDTSDCGVACLLSLIQFYGGESSIEKLRELSGTSKQGTTLLGLYQAADAVGFNAEGCEADISALIEHNQPVILHLVFEQKYQHYVVCYGYEKDKFVIHDPGKGIQFYFKEELENVWISNKCLTLETTEKFIQKKTISRKKRNLIINLLREDYTLIVISVLIGTGISVLGMTTAVFSQKLIDVIIPEKDFRRLWIGFVMVLLLLIIRVGLSALRQFLLFTQSKDFNIRIIGMFYNHLLKLPKNFFDTRKIGELVARLNDTRRIQQVISTLAGNILIDAITVIVTLGFVFYYSWIIGLVLICSLPILFYIVYGYNTRLINAQNNVMVGYAQSESNFINTMQGIDTIKNFNQQSIFERLNQNVYNLFQNNVFDLGKINIKLSTLSGTISILVLVTTIGVGSNLVLTGWLKLGEFMAVLTLVSTIVPAILNLALIAIPLNEAKVAFNRMFEFTNVDPEKNEGENLNIKIESIEIKDLSFRFAGRKRLLENISMVAKKNEMVFIIGESGCGKSTLCKILESFYEPELGEIFLNHNISLKKIAINEWRKEVGVIPQDIYIFNGTVLDNICLGVVPEQIEKTLEIIDTFGLKIYFDQMPQSYMTIVGEEGINLSGGQKQIIALARLLIKNPQVLILDEPTSAMDRETEKLTLDILNSIKKEKIIIFVSHRLNILKKNADKIYLIEKGRINLSGTHFELLGSDNLYSSYWKELECDTNEFISTNHFSTS